MADHFPDDEKSFLRKHGWWLGAVTVSALAALAFVFADKADGTHSKAKPQPEVQMIKLLPPPPPPKLPPPPPPPPSLAPPPKEEMVEQEPVNEPEEKPVETTAVDEPPALDLGVDAPGSGPGDGFGLVGRPGGTGGGGTGKLGGRKGGSRFGWYAGQVQSAVQEALLKNEKTRQASLRVEIRIWADANARITRASLGQSTKDPSLDKAIIEDVLIGLKLKEAPPSDMPMPIVMRITAKRPG